MKKSVGLFAVGAACVIGATSSALAGTGPAASKSVAPAAKNGRIIFRECDPMQCDIYTMLGDGSQVTNLLPGATDDRDPEFSPNAQKIVFRRVDAGAATC
jgi:hypothetical protein